jgi:hypothetical protein
MEWKESMTLDKWNKIRVIVTGGHMPRNRNVISNRPLTGRLKCSILLVCLTLICFLD